MPDESDDSMSVAELLEDFQAAVDRAADSDNPRLITTLQSFAGNGDLLWHSLGYAKARGVDVLIAAESDGTFY